MLEKKSLLVKATFFLLFIILFLFALIQARGFLYPLAIAVLFAYLLYPMAIFLEKNGIPRIIAILLSIVVAIVVIIFVISIISNQIQVFFDDFPALRQRTLNNLENLAKDIEESFGVSTREQKNWVKERINSLFTSGGAVIKPAFEATAGTIVAIGLQPVFVFFLLYYRDKFREFILRLAPDRVHRKTEKIINEVSFVTKRYMGGILIVVLILCFLNSLGLSIVGLDYAIVLGIISAFFNFIPYFGTLIGGIVPFTFALLTMESPKYAAGVVIHFLIVQFLENNILTPNIVGGNVKLNPFITILTIMTGGMIWGIPGMFISVPFLAMFKIVCDHVDQLKPFSYLLGTEGTEEHAVTLTKIRNFLGFGKKSKNS